MCHEKTLQNRAKQKPFMEYALKGILITLELHTIGAKKSV
jgi:hypothetical protein